MSNNNLHQESRRVILQYAIFRWENAVIMAGAILLTAFFPKPFSWWPVWGWPVLGLAGVGLIFYSSLTNTKANARLLQQHFQASFDLREIQLDEMKEAVVKALEYQKRIDDYLLWQEDSPVWGRAQDTAAQIQDWIRNVYQLARRLDSYRRDELIEKELRKLPKEIADIEKQRKAEKDANLLAYYDQLLASKRQHLQTLQDLDAHMKQADLLLAHSLSALATVDSQIRLIGAQDVDRGRSDRLRSDIQEQVNRLGDLIASINEVYEIK